MWVRQCDFDGETDFLPPIPARIASNEEFVPPPQSAEQKEYEARLAQISEETARRQGRSRRDFLRSGSGMAAALLALNQVYGDSYEVNAEEVEDPTAFEEKWPKDQFVFDVQTHHVDVSNNFELGSTFHMLSFYTPRTCMHMLGQMLQVAGADHILWGTDSIWNGSPQSQIERMRRFKIADDLVEKYQYPQMTAAVKDQILGLNAAHLMGVDPAAARKAIKADKLSALREGRRYDPATRSNTQYGWLWVEDGGAPTVPVGA